MSKAKKNMYSEKYYDIDEEDLQQIIQRAQSYDSDAQNQLIEIFSNFLSKYTAMLYHNRYSLQDYDIRKFIALFVKDPEARMRLNYNNINHKAFKEINEVMRGIHYMVRRYGSSEDIEQTVNLSFIQCLDRYERKESKAGGYVPFSGYLYSYYFYLLQKNVNEMLIDQLGRKTFPLVTNTESESEFRESDSEKMVITDTPKTASAEDLIFGEEIDENWVSGETASHPFNILTVQERQLIKWRFISGLKSGEIAEKTTEHPNTVREHFVRIRSKISNAVKEENLI